MRITVEITSKSGVSGKLEIDCPNGVYMDKDINRYLDTDEPIPDNIIEHWLSELIRSGQINMKDLKNEKNKP